MLRCLGFRNPKTLGFGFRGKSFILISGAFLNSAIQGSPGALLVGFFVWGAAKPETLNPEP